MVPQLVQPRLVLCATAKTKIKLQFENTLTPFRNSRIHSTHEHTHQQSEQIPRPLFRASLSSSVPFSPPGPSLIDTAKEFCDRHGKLELGCSVLPFAFSPLYVHSN